MWITAPGICQNGQRSGYVEFNTYFTDNKDKIKETPPPKSFLTKTQIVLYCLWVRSIEYPFIKLSPLRKVLS